MTEPTPQLFGFESVTVVRGDRTILDIDTLLIPDGRATAIIGPSGSGKSTLLRLCNRLDVETSGTITYRGAPLAERNPLDHRRDVAMVFQRPVALDGTALDNLRVADASIESARANQLLERVGLPGISGQQASSLSGGELQRLSIARCLATGPSVLLLDEATSALDPANTLRIEELVANLAADGIVPIWVTHSPDQMRRVADRVIVIIDGVVRVSGSADELVECDDPAVMTFLGEWSP